MSSSFKIQTHQESQIIVFDDFSVSEFRKVSKDNFVNVNSFIEITASENGYEPSWFDTKLKGTIVLLKKFQMSNPIKLNNLFKITSIIERIQNPEVDKPWYKEVCFELTDYDFQTKIISKKVDPKVLEYKEIFEDLIQLTLKDIKQRKPH